MERQRRSRLRWGVEKVLEGVVYRPRGDVGGEQTVSFDFVIGGEAVAEVPDSGEFDPRP